MISSVTTPILQTLSLSLSIGTRALFRDLNLTIEAGQCIGVLGQNGTGKTTLLHTLINFRPTDTGEILLLGHHLNWPHTSAYFFKAVPTTCLRR